VLIVVVFDGGGGGGELGGECRADRRTEFPIGAIAVHLRRLGVVLPPRGG